MSHSVPIEFWIKHCKNYERVFAASIGKLTLLNFQVRRDDTREVGCLPFILLRQMGKIRVTIRITLMDHNYPAPVVITNMTVLPEVERRMGHGERAIHDLRAWARSEGFDGICATQVSNPHSAAFWTKCGFRATDNVTKDHVCEL